MASNFTEWQLQLIDIRTGKPIDDDSGTYNVLTDGSPAEITLYSDAQATSQANPGTMTNGIIRFYTADTTTSVDISVFTSTGHAFFLESVGVSQHRLLVNPEQHGSTLILPYLVVGASDAVVDTGVTIPANVLVKDCFLNVTTVGTGALLDVGTSTDTDGFIDGIDGATTGFAAGIAETDASAHTFGALIASTTSAAVRKLYRRANTTSGASVVYKNATVSSKAGAGYIYLTLLRLPAQ